MCVSPIYSSLFFISSSHWARKARHSKFPGGGLYLGEVVGERWDLKCASPQFIHPFFSSLDFSGMEARYSKFPGGGRGVLYLGKVAGGERGF